MNLLLELYILYINERAPIESSRKLAATHSSRDNMGDAQVEIMGNTKKKAMDCAKVDSEDISIRNGCQELWKKLQDSDVDTMMDTYLSSIKSSFHVGKNASIGWLHMHSRVSALDTIALDHMEDKSMENGLCGKNTDIDEIIQYLKNM